MKNEIKITNEEYVKLIINLAKDSGVTPEQYLLHIVNLFLNNAQLEDLNPSK